MNKMKFISPPKDYTIYQFGEEYIPTIEYVDTKGLFRSHKKKTTTLKKQPFSSAIDMLSCRSDGEYEWVSIFAVDNFSIKKMPTTADTLYDFQCRVDDNNVNHNSRVLLKLTRDEQGNDIIENIYELKIELRNRRSLLYTFVDKNELNKYLKSEFGTTNEGYIRNE